MSRLFPIVALSLCAGLSACDGGGTPQPTVTPSRTLNVTLNDSSKRDLPWSGGAGTFALFAIDSAATGTPVATSSVSPAGMTTIILPGSAEGIEAKTSSSPGAGLAGLGVNCTSTLTETASTAKSLYIGSAAFSSAQGDVPISEYTTTASGSMLRYPVYVTQDDTVSGQLTCGSATYAVSLPLKRGWNVLAVINGTTSSTSSIRLDTSSTLHYAVR